MSLILFANRASTVFGSAGSSRQTEPRATIERTGACFDNAMSYSFWATVKTEFNDLKVLLEDYKMKGSIGTVGDAYDNGLMESAIGLYKTEVIDFDNAGWRDSRHVEDVTAEWFHWYNHRRLHSSIGYLPPVEYYDNYNNQHAAPMAA